MSIRVTTIGGSNAAEPRMAALLCERYGPPEVLRLGSLPRPVPRSGELLVRVVAAAVTSGDVRVRALHMPAGLRAIGRLALGLRGPRQPVLGAAFAGVIEDVGNRVGRWRVGEAVYGLSGMRMGAHAGFLRVNADGAVGHKPACLSFQEAATLPFGGTTVLSFLRRSGLQAGQRVLVNGASGAVSTAAVQIARVMGANVVGVCGQVNASRVRALGAHEVIDHAREDFTARLESIDLVFDAVCNAPLPKVLQALRPGGCCLRLQAGLPEMLAAPWIARRSGHRVITGVAEELAADIDRLSDLAQRGLLRAEVGHLFGLAQGAQAHRRAEHGAGGERRGAVVLAIG